MEYVHPSFSSSYVNALLWLHVTSAHACMCARWTDYDGGHAHLQLAGLSMNHASGYSKVIIWLWHSLHGGGYPSSPYRHIHLYIYVHGSQGDKEWKTYSSLKPIIHMHASACVLWPRTCNVISVQSHSHCFLYLYISCMVDPMHYVTWDIAIACPQLQHASD